MMNLATVNNWDSGAALRVKASFVQGEIQLNLTEQWLAKLRAKPGLEMLAGLASGLISLFPMEIISSIRKKEKPMQDINYGKTNAFFSVTKTLFNNTLKLGAIIGADKNDYFPLTWSPRFTAVYSPVYKHNFRASYQSGYRYPSIFEAYSNINSGGVKRVGGLPVMSNGIFENAWLQTSISAFQSAVLNDINKNGLSKNDAIVKNENLLTKNPYTYIQPEHVESLKPVIKDYMQAERFSWTLIFISTTTIHFIAQANMNVPNTADC